MAIALVQPKDNGDSWLGESRRERTGMTGANVGTREIGCDSGKGETTRLILKFLACAQSMIVTNKAPEWKGKGATRVILNPACPVESLESF